MSRSREEILKEIAKLKKELNDIPCKFCGKTPIYAKGLCRSCYGRLLNRGTCEYAARKKKEKHKKPEPVQIPWREKLTQDAIGYKIEDKPYKTDISKFSQYRYNICNCYCHQIPPCSYNII